MALDTNIGYVNADNNNALEPKLTTVGNEKTQTPENLTSKDANDLINFIKEDREQINTNESNISNNANDISSKADQTSLDAVDNRLQNVENDYLTSTDKTELQDNINTVDSKADQNALDISNLPPVPTQTSDLTNNGSDGVNPFITANDLPPAPFDENILVLKSPFTYNVLTPSQTETITVPNFYEFEQNSFYELTITAKGRNGIQTDIDLEGFFKATLFSNGFFGLKAYSPLAVTNQPAWYTSTNIIQYTDSTAFNELELRMTNKGGVNNRLEDVTIIVKKVNINSIQ